MTLNDIAIQIANDKEYLAICKRIARSKDLADDLFQHVLTLILEGKCKGVIEVAKAGNLKWFFIRVCSTQYHSTNGSEFTRLMKHFEPVYEYLPIEAAKEDYDHEEDEAIIFEYNMVKDIIRQRGWYHEKLFELYLEYGSIRALSKATGISHVSVFKSIKETREYVNKYLDSPINAVHKLVCNQSGNQLTLRYEAV